MLTFSQLREDGKEIFLREGGLDSLDYAARLSIEMGLPLEIDDRFERYAGRSGIASLQEVVQKYRGDEIGKGGVQIIRVKSPS